MKIEYYPNMTGLAGTERTVRAMERLIREGTRDPTVIDTAQQLVRGIDQKDYKGQAKRLFEFVQKRVQYVKDPVGVELVKTPLKTLHDRTGDCDDQAVLFSALAKAIGFHTRLKAIKSDPRWPSEFSHVYSQIDIPGRGWVTADTIVPAAVLGWEAPKNRQFGSRVWESGSGMSGFGFDVDTGATSFGDGIMSSADLDYDVEEAGDAFGAAGEGYDVDQGATAFGATPDDVADVILDERSGMRGMGFNVDEGIEGMRGFGLSGSQLGAIDWTSIINNSVNALTGQQQQTQTAATAAAAPKPSGLAKYAVPAAIGLGSLVLVLMVMKRKR